MQYEQKTDGALRVTLPTKEMRDALSRLIIESQESLYKGQPHAITVALNSGKDFEHSVLFLGFVQKDGQLYAQLADGMMTNTYNPLTWGAYQGIIKDQETGTYLMPVDTFLSKFIGISVISSIGSPPQEAPKQAQIQAQVPVVQKPAANAPVLRVIQGNATQQTSSFFTSVPQLGNRINPSSIPQLSFQNDNNENIEVHF